MSAALDSWKLGPRDLVVFVPWPTPWVSYHLRLPGCYSLLLLSASVPEWPGPDSWKLYAPSAKRHFFNNRTPISALFGHGVCGPGRKSRHIVHSAKCLHVVRIVESHIWKKWLSDSSKKRNVCPSTHEVSKLVWGEVLLHGCAVN